MNVIIKNRNSDVGAQINYHFDGEKWVKNWETKQLACIVSSTNHLQEIEPVRLQVLAGELSPLAYHIESNLFSVKLLSDYTGVPKRHIKKHLKPENFQQLDEETLNKYAWALGISVEELKKV